MRFSTPIDMFNHRRVSHDECTPTLRRYRRMQKECPRLAEQHKHKFVNKEKK